LEQLLNHRAVNRVQQDSTTELNRFHSGLLDPGSEDLIVHSVEIDDPAD
jgi:hypothetical protein